MRVFGDGTRDKISVGGRDQEIDRSFHGGQRTGPGRRDRRRRDRFNVAR
jgi:hypothetical protein